MSGRDREARVVRQGRSCRRVIVVIEVASSPGRRVDGGVNSPIV